MIKQMKAMRFALFEFIKGAQNNIITPSQSSAQACTLHTQTKHALIALTVTICAYVIMLTCLTKEHVFSASPLRLASSSNSQDDLVMHQCILLQKGYNDSTDDRHHIAVSGQ